MGRQIRPLSLAGVLLLAATLVAGAALPGVAAADTQVRILAGGHPYGMSMALDAAGHRHVVAADQDGDLWYATDRSGSWVSTQLLAGQPHQMAWTSPSVAVDTDQSIHIAVVPATVMDTPGSTGGVRYLTDKGRAAGDFGPTSRMTGFGMTSPSLKVVDGVRYLAYARCACAPGQAAAPLYFKTDRSGSWQTEVIDGDWAYAPSLRIASDGRPSIAYADMKGLRFTRARTRVGDFAAPARIPNSFGGGEPSLALDGANRPHVAWTVWGPHRANVVLYSKLTSSGWQDPRQLGPGLMAALSIDAQGRPHVVLAHDRDGGRVIHRWLAAGKWKWSTISRGEHAVSVAIRAFGAGASIAWSQETMPRGVWVTRD